MFWEITGQGEWELSLRFTVERLSACKPEKEKNLENFIDIGVAVSIKLSP
jgi:hypothetical protein